MLQLNRPRFSVAGVQGGSPPAPDEPPDARADRSLQTSGQFRERRGVDLDARLLEGGNEGDPLHPGGTSTPSSSRMVGMMSMLCTNAPILVPPTRPGIVMIMGIRVVSSYSPK